MTVVRATQYHSLVAAIARALGRGPVSVQPQISFQSCDRLWVADRLVENDARRAATGLPAGGGPGRAGAYDAGRGGGSGAPGRGKAAGPRDHVAGRRRDPAGVRGGTNLPGPDAVIGGTGFREWFRTACLRP